LRQWDGPVPVPSRLHIRTPRPICSWGFGDVSLCFFFFIFKTVILIGLLLRNLFNGGWAYNRVVEDIATLLIWPRLASPLWSRAVLLERHNYPGAVFTISGTPMMTKDFHNCIKLNQHENSEESPVCWDGEKSFNAIVEWSHRFGLYVPPLQPRRFEQWQHKIALTKHERRYTIVSLFFWC